MNIKFALNHMVMPKSTPEVLIDSAIALGIKAIELRNDIGDNSLVDIDRAKAIGAKAKEAGIEILSINALYPFNVWDDELADKAEKLAQLANACGAQALVMCPLNEGPQRTEEQLQEALKNLKVILDKYNIKGLIEPLGFPISSLRFKADAVKAIKALGYEDTFKLTHDTFHHMGAGETQIFAENTGLVHISGVEDPTISFEEMLDSHRLLIGDKDRLDNVGQVKDLIDAGYSGYFSFEPFSEPVWNLEDPVGATSESMAYVTEKVTE